MGALHPRQVGLFSDAILWDLHSLIVYLIAAGIAPSVLAFVLIKLIPKASGGSRPIGLFTALVRVVMRALRRTIGAKWLLDHVPSNWYGVSSRSSGQAAWSRQVAVQCGHTTGQKAVAELFDIRKAFDNLRR